MGREARGAATHPRTRAPPAPSSASQCTHDPQKAVNLLARAPMVSDIFVHSYNERDLLRLTFLTSRRRRRIAKQCAW